MNLDVDILSQINERFSTLRDAEKKVAQWVMDEVSAAANASISEIAQSAQVSEASVTRFAKAIGCKNVREMKIKLAQSLTIGERFVLESPEPSSYQMVYQSIK